MSEILAIGSYTETDLAGLREMGARVVASLDEMRGLEEAERGDVRAVAYKGHHPFGANEMALLPALGVIANYGVGHDAIDVEAAGAAGVRVTNTPEVLNDDVADLAVAMLLMQQRRLLQGDAHVRSGAWAGGESFPLNRKVSGRRAGIMGLGRIGRDIAERPISFVIMETSYVVLPEGEMRLWLRVRRASTPLRIHTSSCASFLSKCRWCSSSVSSISCLRSRYFDQLQV